MTFSRELQGFGCKEVLYFDYKHLDDEKEKQLNCKFSEMDDLIKKCDVVSINLPLTDKTRYATLLRLESHAN